MELVVATASATLLWKMPWTRMVFGQLFAMPGWIFHNAHTSATSKARLVNVFLKCEVSPGGVVRGRRNAMLDDSDVHWHRQIKATVGGVAAAVTGDPAVFVSVSAAHQGPPGGGPVADIVDMGTN